MKKYYSLAEIDSVITSVNQGTIQLDKDHLFVKALKFFYAKDEIIITDEEAHKEIVNKITWYGVNYSDDLWAMLEYYNERGQEK